MERFLGRDNELTQCSCPNEVQLCTEKGGGGEALITKKKEENILCKIIHHQKNLRSKSEDMSCQ